MQESKRKQQIYALAAIIGTLVLALSLVQVLRAASGPSAQPDDGNPPGTLTPEEMFQRYLNAHIMSVETVDLSESTKSVDKPQAKAGGILGYTIFLRNTGDQFAIVSITDTLPVDLTYVPGSLTTSDGSTANESGGVITWQGAVNSNSNITLTFDAAIDGDAAVDSTISNTVEIGESGNVITRTAVTTVVAGNIPDQTTAYLPLIHKTLSVPTLAVTRPNGHNSWTTSWSASPGAISYELQQANSPDFSNATLFTLSDVSRTFQPAPSINNVYYYRVRASDGSAQSGWSNAVEVVGGYRDDFTSNTSGWERRRLTHIDLVNSWYEIEPHNNKDWYILQIDDKWDWGIASPLARAPQVPYVIEYDAKLVNPGNLTSYGIVFGGDLTDVDCPNPNPPTTVDGWYKHDQCFNHFYAVNTVYFGDTKMLFERVDRVVWCPDDPNCTGGGSALKRGADTKIVERVSNVQTREWNKWRVEVRESGITLFVNGSKFMEYDLDDSAKALQWIHEPYFGVFGSTDEYKPSTGRYEHILVMPLDD